MIVKMLGLVTSISSYESAEKGTVSVVSVTTGDRVWNCRNVDADAWYEGDRVIITGDLKIHSKGQFIEGESLVLATDADVQAFTPGGMQRRVRMVVPDAE